MADSPGSDPIPRLNAALEGRYRIEREIGQGGMATVYLAEDLRHERNVALKVLKPELAAVVGAERFLAEIKTTANLQHPHILPLHDSGEADSFLFFVMPYVEGDTLRDKIDREKQLGVDEALEITKKVASALDYAHKHGVVHRDIKPGNILLSPEGEPTVADFGIALAVAQAGGGRVTETGLSVGTPHYMSPEQATGERDIDPRTDIYALGCVLYEMLVGQPPYTGVSAQAVLGQIITGKPVSALEKRSTVPPNVDAAIRKALEKLPADRFSTAQELAKALGDPGFRHGEAVPGTAASASPGFWKPLAIAATAAAVALAGWSARGLRRPATPTTEPLRLELSTEGWAGLQGAVGRLAAMAPDGSSMIIPIETTNGVALGVKLRGSSEITPLGDTQGARDIVYSPDSRRIAYVLNRELRVRPVEGGPHTTLATNLEPAIVNRSAIDWLDDGSIVYEEDIEGGVREIVRIRDGGDPQFVYGGAVAPVWLRGLPGSRGALVIDCEGTGTCRVPRSRLHLVDLSDPSSVVLLAEEVAAAWYVETGHIVYVRADGAVFAMPFDLDSMEPAGEPQALFDGVRVTSNTADMWIARDGTLVYFEGPSVGGDLQVVWVDRSGNSVPVDPTWDPQGAVTGLSLSPDDAFIAVSVLTEEDGGNLWLKTVPDGPVQGPYEYLRDEGVSQRAVWSPSGDSIAFVSDVGGLFHARSMGPFGTVPVSSELLRRDAGIYEIAFAPDRPGLYFREGRRDVESEGADIGYVDLTTGSVRMILDSPQDENQLAISRDGRFVAYTSDRDGQLEVYVSSTAPGDQVRIPISTGGGREPLFAHNGRELFYRAGGTGGPMWVASFVTEPTFRVTGRAQLFDASSYVSSADTHLYDVTSDDERFLMYGVPRGGDALRLVMVQNWFTELEEQVGAR